MIVKFIFIASVFGVGYTLGKRNKRNSRVTESKRSFNAANDSLEDLDI